MDTPLTRSRNYQDNPRADRITSCHNLTNQASGFRNLRGAGHVEVTNATTKNPAYFETPTGRFRYQHIAPHLVFGVEKQKTLDGALVADREKTLLDFLWWHINDGHRPGFTWEKNEFERWRFQDPTGEVNEQRLFACAERFGDSRMQDAAQKLAEHLRTTRMNFVTLPRPTETRFQDTALIDDAPPCIDPAARSA